ncbi:MAG: molybdopterin converting factor subunit 1, partial [Methylococcales bacterium]
MAIRIRFFASFREQVGYSEKSIPAQGLATVSDVLDALDEAKTLPDTMLYAVNMQYANRKTPVRDGDEVAFFPPVTGG